MSTSTSTQKRNIIIVAVAITILLAFIPTAYYDNKPTSGRYINEGIIVDYGQDYVTVQLFDMNSTKDIHLTDNYLYIEGTNPEYIYTGQKVKIGYSFDGAIESRGHSVEVCFQKDGSVLGRIINAILPFGVTNDYQLVDMQLTGKPLTYNIAR